MAGMIVMFLFWVGGFDYDKRDFTAFVCALMTFYCSGAVYFLSGIK